MKPRRLKDHPTYPRFTFFFYFACLFDILFAISLGSLSATLMEWLNNNKKFWPFYFWVGFAVIFFICLLIFLVLAIRQDFERERTLPYAVLVSFAALFLEVGAATLYAYLGHYTFSGMTFFWTELALALSVFFVPLAFIFYARKGKPNGSKTI